MLKLAFALSSEYLQLSKLSENQSTMNPYVTPEFDVTQLDYTNSWSRKEPIHVASGDGDLVEVKRLVDNGVDVSTRDPHGNTPIFYAISGGQYDIVLYLLNSGVSVNSSPSFNFTSLLHLAANSGEGQICDLLIKKGAKVNACNTCGHTPLFFAAYRGSDVTARVLIESGAEVNIPANYPQWTAPPFLMATRQDHVDLMKLLVKAGANPEFADRDGMTPLHHAVFDGRLNAVHCLIADLCVSMYASNLNKETPLISAVRCNRMDIITMLISAGYDLTRDKSILDAEFNRKMTNKSRQEIFSYLQDISLKVKSLQHLACLRVRDVLIASRRHRCLSDAVETLPVPARLKDCLNLTQLL